MIIKHSLDVRYLYVHRLYRSVNMMVNSVGNEVRVRRVLIRIHSPDLLYVGVHINVYI